MHKTNVIITANPKMPKKSEALEYEQNKPNPSLVIKKINGECHQGEVLH